MEGLSKVDPYVIEDLQFYMNKKTRVISVKSIICSLIILAITIIISYESIQNIWTDRQKLDLISSSRQLTDQPLTSSPLCVVSRVQNQAAPQSTLRNINEITLQEKYLSVSTMFDGNEQVLKRVGSKDFYCYDMAGSLVNAEYKIHLEVSDTANIFFRTHSLEAAIEGRQDQFHWIEGQTTLDTNKDLTYYLDVKKFRSQIYDKLYVKYEPESKLQISKQQLVFTSNMFTGSKKSMKVVIRSERSYPYQFTDELKLVRQNIGQILGKFFSWFTILLLLFTVIIAPIIQYNFKIKLAQGIYNNQVLQTIDPSLLSYFKYILSTFKLNLFNQQALDHVFQSLETDLNIINMVKKQVVIKKLIQESKVIQQNKQQTYMKPEEQKDNKQQFNDLFQLQQSEINQKQFLGSKNYDYNQKNIINGIIFSSDPQKSDKNIIQSAISSLDVGETSISLITNKGQGYGTKWNTIIVTVFFVLVLVFLILAGFLSIFTEQSIDTLLEGVQKIEYLQWKRQNFIFRGIQADMFDTFNTKAQIINQNYNVVENISLLTGSACSDIVAGLGQTGTDWYCFSKDILLFNGGKGQRKGLLIYLQSTGFFGVVFGNIQIVYRSHKYSNQQMVEVTTIYNKPAPTTINKIQVQIFEKVTQSEDQIFWVTSLQQYVTQTTKYGILFDLLNTMQSMKIQENTIWDVIDNSWGIFILCFTIILSKISKVINIREREKITSKQANLERNDIVGVILSQFRLGTKIYSQELSSSRYYSRSNINRQKLV